MMVLDKLGAECQAYVVLSRLNIFELIVDITVLHGKIGYAKLISKILRAFDEKVRAEGGEETSILHETSLQERFYSECWCSSDIGITTLLHY